MLYSSTNSNKFDLLQQIMWCVLVLFFGAVFSQARKLPCEELFSVDISDGVKLENQSIVINNTVFDPKNYYIHKGKTLGCICNIKSCLRKCCGPDEQSIEKNVPKQRKIYNLEYMKVHK